VLRIISSIRAGANGITLTWSSISNRTYRIACKGNVNELVWSELTGPMRQPIARCPGVRIFRPVPGRPCSRFGRRDRRIG
jgi:hypothetical protein